MRKWSVLLVVGLAVLFGGCSCGKSTAPQETGTLEVIVKEDSPDSALTAGATVTLTEQKISKATNNVGFAAFGELPIGKYTVQVTKAGYLTETKQVAISAGKKTEIILLLYPAGMGDLVAWVSLGTSDKKVNGQVKTGEKTIQILGSMPATFRLKVGKQSVEGSYLGSDPKTVEVTISERKTTTVNITLSEYQYIGEVTGIVQDKATSLSLAGATVLLFCEGTVKTQKADTAGAFRFDKLLPGSYSLQAKMADYHDFSLGFSLTLDQKITQNLALGKIKRGSISGLVVGNGKLLNNAVVSISGGTVVTTGLNGEYKFTNLLPDRYQISVKHVGYAFVSEDWILPEGDNLTVNFTLEPNTGDIAGTFLRDSSSGTQPADASSVLVMEGTQLLASTDVLADGTYRLSNVTAGTRTVIVRSPSLSFFTSQSFVVVVAPLKTTNLSATIGFPEDIWPYDDNSFDTAHPNEMNSKSAGLIWGASDEDYWTFSATCTSTIKVTVACQRSRDFQAYADFYTSAHTKFTSVYFGSGQNEEKSVYITAQIGEQFFIKVRPAFGKWSHYDYYTLFPVIVIQEGF